MYQKGDIDIYRRIYIGDMYIYISSLVHCDLNMRDFPGSLRLLPFCFDAIIITQLSLGNCLIILFGDK